MVNYQTSRCQTKCVFLFRNRNNLRPGDRLLDKSLPKARHPVASMFQCRYHLTRLISPLSFVPDFRPFRMSTNKQRSGFKRITLLSQIDFKDNTRFTAHYSCSMRYECDMTFVNILFVLEYWNLRDTTV